MAESGHVIKRMVVSMPSFAKPVLATLIAVLGILSIWRLIQYFAPEYIYQKDFLQEYLLAKGVLSGTDPYAPLPALAVACRPVVPFPVTAISLVPLLAVLELMWLLWTMERFSVRHGAECVRRAEVMPG